MVWELSHELLFEAAVLSRSTNCCKVYVIAAIQVLILVIYGTRSQSSLPTRDPSRPSIGKVMPSAFIFVIIFLWNNNCDWHFIHHMLFSQNNGRDLDISWHFKCYDTISAWHRASIMSLRVIYHILRWALLVENEDNWRYCCYSLAWTLFWWQDYKQKIKPE